MRCAVSNVSKDFQALRIKSYGIHKDEAISAITVVRAHITSLCVTFDVLSVQYSCFPKTVGTSNRIMDNLYTFFTHVSCQETRDAKRISVLQLLH